MKKNTILTFLLIIIIILLALLGYKIYEEYNSDEVQKSIYPYEEYSLDIEGFTYINTVLSNNKVYSLYKTSNEYILKEIDTTSKKKSIYNKYIDSSCKLVNDSNKPYVICENNNLYSSKLEFNKENNIVINNESEILASKCNLKCLEVRKDTATNKVGLYKDNTLKEEDVNNYGVYENGIYTYDLDKIKIYNLNNSFKEFTTLLDISKRKITLSKNEHTLYVLENKEIDVYNLYERSLVVRIDLYKIKDDIKYIEVNSNKLYVFTSHKVYVYDVYDIEMKENNTLFEDDYVNNKISQIKEEYEVNVRIGKASKSLEEDYDIKVVSNYNDMIDGLSYLDDYLKVFNKDFFKRFYEDDKKGLNIYLVSEISKKNESSNIVGLSYLKNNEYAIVINLSSKENLLNVLFHETMHIIDNYLELKGFKYEWNSLNPTYFEYEDLYDSNKVYSDTINGSKYNEEVYFIDNYARVSEKEDRARIFEHICICEDFTKYPNLDSKMQYLKGVIRANFPEISYLKSFA